MKKFKWLIWIGIIAIAGVAIWYWKFRVKTPAVVLETEKPRVGFIASTITATGTIQPVDTVAVGTQVSGTIKNIYADFNSKVKKGQLLAELDKSLLLAQVQQFSANLQEAQNQLVYQKSNFDRQTQLFNAGAISKADFETAQYQYNGANANVQSVSSQLQAAQKNLSYANIYSPIDGTVLSRTISAGQTVASSFNTPTLFSIAKDLTRMQVRAAVDEADIGTVKKGQRVEFTVDAFPDDHFNGSVEDIRLQPSVSSNVVTYVTIIDAPNGNLKLKPGMTASIIVYTKEVENAMLISARALKFQPDSTLFKYTIVEGERPGGGQSTGASETSRSSGRIASGYSRRAKDSSASGSDTSIVVKRAIVWVKKDSSIIKKFIRIGLNDNTQVQVLAGLNADDDVIDGVQQVSDQKNNNSTVRSPFMPPRRNNRSSSGGAGGGSGNRAR